MAERKKKQEDEGGGVPAWVVTFGDMMSLLLTFFVLLLSFSTISEDAFNEAMMSLQGAFGVLDRFESLINPIPKRKEDDASQDAQQQAQQEALEQVARELRRQMQVAAQETDVKIEFDEEGGLKISLPNKLLFGSGSARLLPEAYPVVDELSQLLKDVPDSFVEIRGHTDGRPLGNTANFRDNYDLSFARADAVTRRLNEFGNLPMEQFEITACGSSQPIATNATPEGRTANRRVEIYVRGAFNRKRIEEFRRRVELMEDETDANQAAAPAPVPAGP